MEDVPLQELAAFADKSAAITEEGDLIIWGSTRNGSTLDMNGQPFRNNLTNPRIFEGHKFKQVSCGKEHLAAITTDGRLLMMGNSDHGKLGLSLDGKASQDK